jgi:hypothetical protein
MDGTGTAADPGNPGQDLSLYEVPERLSGSRVNLLVAVNGTTERDGTRRRYGLTTPAEIRDPVAWTYQLTKDQYAAQAGNEGRGRHLRARGQPVSAPYCTQPAGRPDTWGRVARASRSQAEEMTRA